MLRWITGILTGLAALAAAAQEYPSRAVTLVVPYLISGPTDIRRESRMTKTYKLMAANGLPAISDTLSRIVRRAIRLRVEASGAPGTTTRRLYYARCAACGAFPR